MNEHELSRVFIIATAQALNVPVETLSLETNRSDVAEWDSFAQIVLFLALEEQFEIRFSTLQIKEFDSLQAIFSEVKRQKCV